MLLNLNSKDYLYLQVYEKIKNKILNGQLKFDEKLPSIRNLAHENKISYNTVTNAYVLLEEEGYIYSKGRIGFFVSKKKDFLKLEKIKPINNDVNAKLDFSFSGVDLNFPFYNWKKSFNKAIDQFNLEFLKKSDPKGDIHLRKSISNYLKKARNIDANYENIIISAG
ncbi:MAG: GntR family transcriptional regulator, partial [Tissierellia bacterium]|nr:GntR family transcriptional regulator [Tissierellia bacterium]